MDMESDNPGRTRTHVKEEFYTSDKSLVSILLLSLCMALLALSMLLLGPTQVSYKNVSSLSELNEDKVKYYTESQHIYLIFKSGAKPDTLRSVADYLYSVKKENLREEGRRMQEYLASLEEDDSSHEPAKEKVKNSAAPAPISDRVSNSSRQIEETIPSHGTLRGSEPSGTEAYALNPDQRPVFPKGQKGLELYLAKHKRTPFQVSSVKLSGSVDLRFLVHKDGSISDIRILKGLGHGCDEEAVRLVKNMPAWIPARKDNQVVSCHEKLSVWFSYP